MVNDLALENIPDGWQVSRLGEYLDSVGGSIQTGPFGSQLHASDYVEKGIPSVMPKNISVEGINQDDIARINEVDVVRLSKYRLAAGDIIYSRRGDVEKCSLVTELESGWLCGTGCLRVRLGQSSSRVTPEFLHAYLSSPMIREWISRNAIGATMPNLNTGILRDVPFVIPDANLAVFIGKSWKATNNKITINRQINQTLEQMAQALFKSWFVDFDPVVDNALDAGFFEQDIAFPDELLRRAEARRAVRERGDFKPLPDATRQLFPAAFEECAEPSLGLGGWVPQGWNAESLENVTSLIIDHRGKTPKKLGGDWSERGHPAISAKNIKNGRLVRHDTIRYVDSSLYTRWMKDPLLAGDILMTSEAPLGELLYLVKSHEYLLSQRLYGIRADKDFISGCYLYFWLQTNAARADIDGRATGTTVVGIRQSELKQIKVMVPQKNVLDEFSNLVSNCLEKIESNEKQCIELEKIRDELLPQLISGKLRLDNIEADLAKEGVA